ncbi:hypothetical protein JAAARDRAFT_431984 [Jaapia argillacea MUCL 33604]|uniref:Uncharacterized protein n=1 Tax=Jaapia argillacea MUCL 33604 TaxID=933084 RepID=A0A067PEF4_9AGAM|nr:hypothetical protein JAAARDRAFT_431984 [Jaapia argillacea MUCL 33604]
MQPRGWRYFYASSCISTSSSSALLPMQPFERYRLVLHPFLLVFTVGSAISIAIACSPFNYGHTDRPLMIAYAAVTLISIMSALVSFWLTQTSLPTPHMYHLRCSTLWSSPGLFRHLVLLQVQA